MPGALVEQATDDHEVGLGEQAGEVDLARAEVSELESVHDGIGGNKLEIERLRHAQDLLTDTPRADHPERAAGEAKTHVVHPFVPASVAGELILQKELA